MADKSFWHNKKDKTWFQNFWYYYKVHVIAGLLVLALLTYGLYQCATRVTPDLTICYIGDLYFEDGLREQIETNLSQYIADADGKDGAVVRFKQINIATTSMDMQQAAMLEIASGETQLFITSKATFDAYAREGLYENIGDVLGQSDEVYGVSLSNSQLLTNAGIPTDLDLHAGVRVMIESVETEADRVIRQQNAKAAIAALAK